MDATELQAIMDVVTQYVSIFLPVITYVITGVVAFVKLIKSFDNVKKEVAEKTDSTIEEVEDLKTELTEVKNELHNAHVENQEIKAEMRKLINKIDKIAE